MVISAVSCKVCTRKTTAAACLAAAIEGGVHIECDVEEPNGHISLKPVNASLSGTDYVVLIAQPTFSRLHDMKLITSSFRSGSKMPSERRSEPIKQGEIVVPFHGGRE